MWPQGVAVGKCDKGSMQMEHVSGWKPGLSSMSTSDVPLRGVGGRLSSSMGSGGLYAVAW